MMCDGVCDGVCDGWRVCICTCGEDRKGWGRGAREIEVVIEIVSVLACVEGKNGQCGIEARWGFSSVKYNYNYSAARVWKEDTE